MNPDDFQKATTDILANLSDQGKVTETLTKLVDTYKTTHTTNQTLAEQQEKYEKEINALKETNMNLFLKIQTPEPSTPGGEPPTETLTYDSLIETLGGSK